MDNNNIDPFKVYVRIRPLLRQEKVLVEEEQKKGKSIPLQIVSADNNTVYMKNIIKNNRCY